jgi:hypothetical protein
MRIPIVPNDSVMVYENRYMALGIDVLSSVEMGKFLINPRC